MKLDILAFAAHPDDIELGCSGTLLKQIDQGRSVGIVDLTKGELGSRGNAVVRVQEAEKTAEIMGISVRKNLGFADSFFYNDKEHQLEIIKMIRLYQPEIVLCNAPEDRHPDHGKASKLVSDACFLSGLIKIETSYGNVLQEYWRPKVVYHYIQDRYIKPDFVVDITDYIEKKMEVISAFSSQFYSPDSKEPETPISGADFFDFIRSRAMDLGRPAGIKYAEGFVSERVICVNDLFNLR